MVRTGRADDPVLTMTDRLRPTRTSRAPSSRRPTSRTLGGPAPSGRRPRSPAPSRRRPSSRAPRAARATEQPAPEQPDDRAARPRARRPPSSRRPRPRRRAGSTARATTASSPACAAASREYFGIDPVLVRVGAVALVFLGGAGLLAYLAAVLLVPNEGEDGRPPEAPNRGLAITGAVLLVVAVGVVLPFQRRLGAGLGARAARVPRPCGPLRLAAGFRSARLKGTRERSCAPWRSASRCSRSASSSPSPAPGPPAAGGNGVVAGHRHRGRRRAGRRRLLRLLGALAHPAGAGPGAARPAWSPPPTSTSGAATGEVTYRPASAAAVQRLLPPRRRAPGRRPARRAPRLQAITASRSASASGGAELLVPRGVCVSTNSHVGIGGTSVFDRHGGGIDVDWSDERSAPAGTPRRRGRRRRRHRRPRSSITTSTSTGTARRGNRACA